MSKVRNGSEREDRWKRKDAGVLVSSGDHETTFSGDHDSSRRHFSSGALDGLEEAFRNTRRPLDPGSVVQRAITVGRTVLNPMS